MEPHYPDLVLELCLRRKNSEDKKDDCSENERRPTVEKKSFADFFQEYRTSRGLIRSLNVSDLKGRYTIWKEMEMRCFFLFFGYVVNMCMFEF